MTRRLHPPHRCRADDDGDVRYQPTVTGYNQARRARLRDVQRQTALLTTAIARDSRSAATEMTLNRLSSATRQALTAVKEWADGDRDAEDARPDLVQLAAVVALWAEAIDCPEHISGPRIRLDNSRELPRPRHSKPR